MGFRAPGSLGYSVLIYLGQAFAMLEHLGFFLGPPPVSAFLFGLLDKLVLVRKLVVHHLIS
jgi:hypothetical protein